MPTPPLPPHDHRAPRARTAGEPRAADGVGGSRPASAAARERASRRVAQFARQLAALRRRTAALRQRAGEPLPLADARERAMAAAATVAAATAPALPADVVDDLLATLESLHDAEEALHEQQEALGAARAALDREQRYYRSLFDDAPVAYLVTGPDGEIRAANRAAVALLGVDADAHEPLASYVAPDDRRAFRERLAALPRERDAQVELSLTLVPRGRAPVEALLAARAASDASDAGAPAVRWVVRDVTAERAGEREAGRLTRELRRRVELRTRELEARTAAMEGASREKSRFLTTLSHEIRTPVTAIVGYADLLEAEIGGPLTAAQRTYVERLHASTAHLLALVEGVLDLAKVEAGRVALEAHALPLHATVQDALAMVRPQAEARPVRLEHACADDAGHLVAADEGRVRQILVNLLANAVRFTPAGGLVTVRCGLAATPPERARTTGDGPWVWTAVADTGVGIPRGSLAAVFEPFVQADAGTERVAGGFGLGLAISRRLARLMRGDILAESEAGRGSVFTLWLPAASPTG